MVYLALGSNLGNRAGHIDWACARLAELDQTQLCCVSSIIETEPVGPIAQDAFLNAAAAIKTRLGPRVLLAQLQALEAQRGRNRTHQVRWGPRTLDLDILLYGDLQCDEPGLCIPHMALCDRLFVLEPLAQIAPEVVIPGTTLRISDAHTQLIQRNKTIPALPEPPFASHDQ